MSQTDKEFMEEVEYLKSLRIIKRDAEIADKTGYSKGIVSNYLNGRLPVSEKSKFNFRLLFYSSMQSESTAWRNDAKKYLY